tara:strand:- start:3959 stop:4114 length:156 start_codon:yes stop_codon:yes gene_type:complete
MSTLYIGLIMAVMFLIICMSQILSLQKEVRKLKSITEFLLKEIKKNKSKNV